MRKTVLSALLVVIAVPLSAQSTCETRVDSHQEATTLERVAYCLNEPKEPVSKDKAELIYYGVSSADIEEKQDTPSKNKNPYFDKEKVTVSRGFVGTEQFPAFKNDILSEQELAVLRAQQEEEKARAYAQGYADALRGTQKPAKVQVPEKKANKKKESKSGLSNRQQKPARKVRVVQTQTVVQVASQAEEQVLANTRPAAMESEVTEPVETTQDLSYGVTETEGDLNSLPYIPEN